MVIVAQSVYALAVAASVDATCMQQFSAARPGGYGSPRHPTHIEPSGVTLGPGRHYLRRHPTHFEPSGLTDIARDVMQRMSHPRLSSSMSSYDVVSNICQALGIL
jgi:hypothetical protein